MKRDIILRKNPQFERSLNKATDELPQNIEYGDTAHKPGAPKRGDIYVDTQTSTLYICFADGTWTAAIDATDTNWIDLTDGGATTLHSHAGGSGHVIKDEGTAIATQANLDFRGTFMSAQDDAANTASRIRAGYAVFDAIVDSNQHEVLVSDQADVVTGTSIQVTAPSSPGWVVNTFVNCRVIVYDAAGTTLRGVKVITSNTADTINWSGALAGLIATDTFIIQPSPPVYRRLQEAIAGSHAGILYKSASGETSFTIAATDTVTYIRGDETNASIGVTVTCNKSNVVFDTLYFLDGILVFNESGCVALGCKFTKSSTNAYLEFSTNARGCTAVACGFVSAGGAAVSPILISGPQSTCMDNKIQACLFTGGSSPGLIVASSTAVRTAVVGCVAASTALTNSWTGYLIDFPSTTNDGSVNGNVLFAPTTCTGAMRVTHGFNVSGNYIFSNVSSSGTFIGLSCSIRNIISANIFKTSSVSGTGVYKAIDLTTSPWGNIISSNLFAAVASVSGTGFSWKCVVIATGGGTNIITGNLAALIIGNTAATYYLVEVANAAASGIICSNNVLTPGNSIPPGPWIPVSIVSRKTIVTGNTGIPEQIQDVFRAEYTEDFIMPTGAAGEPTGWTFFNTGGTRAYQNAVSAGTVVLATGAVNNQDAGLRHNFDHILLSNGTTAGDPNTPKFSTRFKFSSIKDVRARIGFGEFAAWVTNMSRPTDGLFLEIDTATLGSATVGTGQTSRWNTSTGDVGSLGSSEVSGASNTVMSWSLTAPNAWATSACAIRPKTATVAPTHINTGSSAGSSVASTYTYAFNSTSAAADRFLIVGISWDDSSGQTITGVTFDGVAMTSIGVLAGTTAGATKLYGLAAPNSGAALNVVVSFSADTPALVVGASLWSGVDQTTTTENYTSASGISNAPSVTVTTSATDRIVFDNVAFGNRVFHVIRKTGAGTLDLGIAAATTGWHTLTIFMDLNRWIHYIFDGVEGRDSTTTNIPTNIVTVGAFIRARAAADKQVEIDLMSWGADRAA